MSLGVPSAMAFIFLTNSGFISFSSAKSRGGGRIRGSGESDMVQRVRGMREVKEGGKDMVQRVDGVS